MTIEKISRLGALTLGCILAAVLVAVGFGINHIRNGGNLDSREQRLSDLRADVLPPPMFLVEAFANASIMTIHRDAYAINDERLAALEKTYWEAERKWVQSEIEGSLKDELVSNARETGRAFWDEVNLRLKPSAKRWDQPAMIESHRRLLKIFRAHRKANDALVANIAVVTEKASNEFSTTTAIILGLAALSFLLVLAVMAGAYLAFRRKVLWPIYVTAETMRDMADGNYDAGVTTQHREDEIGTMSRAIETFRAALKADKARSQTQTEVVETLSEALYRLAEGDLTHRITDMPAGEHEKLKEAFNTSSAKLEAMIGAVRTTAGGVHTGSDEIRTASEDLALRNEQQAASLEETAASVASATSLTRQSVESARAARDAIAQTHARATEGGVVVSKAVEAMGAIEQSAREITQIIDVIDGIAFQTNLLALNAGVEAARAGEAGKGFAVVAGEVRALAQRCAEAADQVKTLISASSSEIQRGVELVGRSGDAFAAITQDIAALSGAIQAMADAAASQAESLAQITTAVSEPDRSTQHNAAMAEECTAAAGSLTREAGLLDQALARFSVSRAPNPPRLARAA